MFAHLTDVDADVAIDAGTDARGAGDRDRRRLGPEPLPADDLATGSI
jgi:hypothetical protein